MKKIRFFSFVFFVGHACALLAAPFLPESFNQHRLVRFPRTCDGHLAHDQIVQAIQGATHSIHLYMYHIDDDDIINALCQKAHSTAPSPVSVKIILEPAVFTHDFSGQNENNSHPRGSVWQRFEKAGVEIRTISGKDKHFTQIHLKLLLIDADKEGEGYGLLTTSNFDRESLVPGSDARFTQGARDFGIIITRPDLLQECVSVFNSDWQGEHRLPQEPLLIWGPEHQRHSIMQEIEKAETIEGYQQSVQDDVIINKICERAQSRKEVRLLLMPHPFGKRDYNRDHLIKLAKAGVSIRLFPHDITRPPQEVHGEHYMHAKVFLFNTTRLLVTSCNLYAPSLDENRELGLITEDQPIIADFKKCFEEDWEKSVPLKEGGHSDISVRDIK